MSCHKSGSDERTAALYCYFLLPSAQVGAAPKRNGCSSAMPPGGFHRLRRRNRRLASTVSASTVSASMVSASTRVLMALPNNFGASAISTRAYSISPRTRDRPCRARNLSDQSCELSRGFLLSPPTMLSRIFQYQFFGTASQKQNSTPIHLYENSTAVAKPEAWS